MTFQHRKFSCIEVSHKSLRSIFLVPIVLVIVYILYNQMIFETPNVAFKLPGNNISTGGLKIKRIGTEKLNSMVVPSGKNRSKNELTAVNLGTERFHVILTFRIIKSSESTNASLRMNEYIYCLKSFLNNSHVKQVHLMHDSPEMPGYIQKKAGAHPKLMLHLVDSPDVVLTLHQFAFTHLQGEVVVITQADIILGEGFGRVDGKLLARKKLFYSLSRHERECFKQPNYCHKYVGSHDSFIFVPNGNIAPRGQKLLSHPIFFMGTENTVMWVYSRILKYQILNPCLTLKIYHHHCSGVRKYLKTQRRVSVVFGTSRPVRTLGA